MSDTRRTSRLVDAALLLLAVAPWIGWATGLVTDLGVAAIFGVMTVAAVALYIYIRKHPPTINHAAAVSVPQHSAVGRDPSRVRFVDVLGRSNALLFTIDEYATHAEIARWVRRHRGEMAWALGHRGYTLRPNRRGARSPIISSGRRQLASGVLAAQHYFGVLKEEDGLIHKHNLTGAADTVPVFAAQLRWLGKNIHRVGHVIGTQTANLDRLEYKAANLPPTWETDGAEVNEYAISQEDLERWLFNNVPAKLDDGGDSPSHHWD